jgi:hypothetical protein
MRNNDDKWLKEIRPVSKEETTTISDKFGQLAIGIQTVFNAFQRQALTNLGTFALHKDKTNPLNFSSLTNGLGSRFLYQAVATYPALQIRKILTDKTDLPHFAINFATTGIETAFGVPLEVNSSLKTLKLLGIDIAKKDLLIASTRTFFPFLIRNSLAWCAINSNPNNNDFFSKITYGALAGAISTPFHNIGIKAMENSANKSWEETWNAVLKEIRKQPSTLFRGSPFRSLSIAATAFLLSPQTTDLLSEKCNEIFDYYNDKTSSNPKPSNFPSDVSISKVSDNKKNEKTI